MDDISTPRSSHAAHDDLRYIRQTLAAAGHISTVPGKGLIAIGVAALGAVYLDGVLSGPGGRWVDPDPGAIQFIQEASHRAPQLVWLVLLVLAVAIGVATMRDKARRTSQTVWSPVLRKALWGYGAAMGLGAILSAAALISGRNDMVPEIWLGCYGVALVSAGGYSVSPVRWMGFCFLATALGAAVTSPSLGLTWLALGFGWVHIAFGAYIAWRYDG